MHVLETSNVPLFGRGLLTSRIAEIQSVGNCLKYVSIDTENLNNVTQPNEEDLKEIGIKLVRHRNNNNKKKYQGYKSQYFNKSVDDESAIQTKEQNVADSEHFYFFSYEE